VNLTVKVGPADACEKVGKAVAVARKRGDDERALKDPEVDLSILPKANF